MQLRFVVLLMGLAARRLQKRRAPPALPQHGLDAATLARLAAATRKLERSYAAPPPGDTVRYYASREPSLGRRGHVAFWKRRNCKGTSACAASLFSQFCKRRRFERTAA